MKGQLSCSCLSFFDTCLSSPVAKLWQVPLEYCYFHVMQFFFLYIKKIYVMIREALHIFKSEKVSTTCVHVLIVSLFFGVGEGERG